MVYASTYYLNMTLLMHYKHGVAKKMKSKRIIIENRTKLSAVDAVELALLVMKQGRISKGPNGSQYCFASRTTNNHVVYAHLNKGGSDRLVVSDA